MLGSAVHVKNQPGKRDANVENRYYVHYIVLGSAVRVKNQPGKRDANVENTYVQFLRKI